MSMLSPPLKVSLLAEKVTPGNISPSRRFRFFPALTLSFPWVIAQGYIARS
jgi:hypothetical protein